MALTSSRSLNTATDSWRAVSSCRDTDPDLFFPVGTTGPALEQIAAAKSVCDSCEAKEPCLEFALTTNQDSGVWGCAVPGSPSSVVPLRRPERTSLQLTS